ncbi:MAG: S-layer homology domain-containing protein [Oscillospiraceae bacterium]|nr:S-layer homology domain-containing protein [Oscillospiraceae bacterium]
MKTFKKALCLVLVAVMAIGLFAVAASAKSLSDYRDAKDVNADYKKAVDVDTQLGILRGRTETDYDPQGTLTRAELATIIYRITTGDVTDKFVDNYKNGSTFSDVTPANWFAGYVNYSADNKYLVGVGEGKYDPNSALTGYQAMAALLRTIGYDKKGEFIGKDWTRAVTKAANESNINGGIVADWSKPISREVTAQLIFNTLQAFYVRYDANSLSYYSNGYETLARKVFNLGGFAPNTTDDYGDPALIWVDRTTGNARVTVKDTPVATYTSPVLECEILKAAGVPETNNGVIDVTSHSNDGTSDSNYTMTHANKECEDYSVGGNGVLTKVYVTGRDAKGNPILYINSTEFYLAKITANSATTHGANGSAKGEVYVSGSAKADQTINSKEYAVGTYVLVSAPNVNDASTTGWDVFGTATKVVGKYTGIKTTHDPKGVLPSQTTVEVDGKAYGISYNTYFDYINVLPTTIGTSYDWYVDAYGYVIGVTPTLVPQNYGVIDQMYYTGNSFDPNKATAKVVYMNASKGDMTVTEIDGTAATSSNIKITWEDNSAYYSVLYNLTTGKIASQKLSAATEFYPANPAYGSKIDAKVFAKNTTMFLYKTLDKDGKAVYTTYTGYASAPSVAGAAIWYVEEGLTADVNGNKYVDYVYVDATLTGLIDLASNAVVLNPAPVGQKYLNDKYPLVNIYEVYDMTGNKSEVYSVNPNLFGGVSGLYLIMKTEGVAYFANPLGTAIETVAADTYTGTNFFDSATGTNYNLDGKQIYLVDASATPVVKTVAAADVTALGGAANAGNVLYVVSVNGLPTYYYIFVQ